MTLDNDDLNAIKEMIDVVHQSLRIEFQAEINILREEFRNGISHLPTKEEFFGRMDTISGELQTVRQEQTVLSFHVSEHTAQIMEIQGQVRNILKHKTAA